MTGQSWACKEMQNMEMQWYHVTRRLFSRIGGILEIAGVKGFLGNADEFYESSDFEGANLRFFVAKWWEKFEGKPGGVSETYKLIMEADIQIDLGKGRGRTPFDSLLARSPDRVLSTCVF
jgi:hypothetical protein